MKNDCPCFELTSPTRGAPAPVLAGVSVQGRLEGVLFALTLRQTYRNTGPKTLEVVYTFPLPVQAVLLGFASELNGQRQVGTVVARRLAEDRYEQALAGGDAPVMLEALGDGLHTANIGNLQPGDELVLEVRFAQLLAFEQSRLRLAIPTTVAPRYGSASAAGLQPQQVPQASLAADYPLDLSLDIVGSLTRAAVECHTHAMRREMVEGGLRLTLNPDARLDRDLVVTVKPREARPSLVIQSTDMLSADAPVVVMAAFQPPAGVPRERIALKLLVDGSGSMGGDSIASARAALQGVLAGLGRSDQVSLSGFGSTVRHLMPLTRCQPQVLRHATTLVDALQADLGGTEMEGALRAVFALPGEAGNDGADVLLVTDGEVWEKDAIVAAARASGHRVFAIGVGAAPAEGVLRALAEATGGACEFATPGEALEAAAARMLVRIRQQPMGNVRVDWGAEPVWQTELPPSVFGGDTVFAFAGLARPATGSAVRLLSGADGQTRELARGEADAPCPAGTLPRMAAARRMAEIEPEQALALALAVRYQLMGPMTNCILVHERAAGEKALEEATLHQVPSMLAAGWGATSTVHSSLVAYETHQGPPPERGAPGRVAYSIDMPSFMAMTSTSEDRCVAPDEFDDVDEPADVPADWQALAQAVVHHLQTSADLSTLPQHAQETSRHPAIAAALAQARALGVDQGQAWLLLAHWLCQRMGDAVGIALLQPQVDRLDPALLATITAAFDQTLPGQTATAPGSARAQRLARLLPARAA